ncbi:MAG: ABC transporter substrate-binding protein [Clostridiales bacterium]|nr:ABC transporter substrate-binding protein [Clostridiales bacterium]
MRKLMAMFMSAALLICSMAACQGAEHGKDAQTGASQGSVEESKTAENNGSDDGGAGTLTSGENEKIRVAVMPYMMSVAVNYAVSQGYDKANGLEFEMVRFATGGPMNEALGADEWDIAADGMAAVFALANYDARWIAETVDSTPGLNAYIRPDSEIAKVKGYNPTYPDIYGSPETLKGATILCPTGTSAHINALKWVEKIGLKDSDVNIVHMEYGQAYQAFLTGQGDVFCSPPAFKVQSDEQGWIIGASLEDLGVKVYDGFAAAGKYCEEHPEAVEKLLEVMLKVVNEFIADEDLAVSEAVKWYKENGKDEDEETIRQELQMCPYLAPSMVEAPDYVLGEGMVTVAEFFADLGQIEPEKVETVQNNLNDTFVKEAYKNITK